MNSGAPVTFEPTATVLVVDDDEDLLNVLRDVIEEEDGHEFRRRQLADPRLSDIPVVGFTGLWNGEEVAHQLALASCLQKPVNLHHLLEAVAHYCSDSDHIDLTSATG